MSDEPTGENFSLRQLTDPQVLTITGFPPYDGQWVRWKPPLELPTEPTWGIVLSKRPDSEDQHVADVGKWAVYGDEEWSPLERTHRLPLDTRCDVLSPENIAAFIPLTHEQVASIEAAHD